MNLQEINSIISKIKNKVYSPIYFLMGEETYYIDYITDLLNQNVLNENEKNFNKTVLYAKDTSIDDLISCCKRYPMMSEYQLVILKEGQDLSRKIETLIQLCIKPIIKHHFWLLITNTKSLDKRKKLYKNIQKFGTIIECKKIYENKVPQWIVNNLNKENYSIDMKSCSMLIDYLGNDLKKIDNQLSKLKIICTETKQI